MWRLRLSIQAFHFLNIPAIINIHSCSFQVLTLVYNEPDLIMDNKPKRREKLLNLMIFMRKNSTSFISDRWNLHRPLLSSSSLTHLILSALLNEN